MDVAVGVGSLSEASFFLTRGVHPVPSTVIITFSCQSRTVVSRAGTRLPSEADVMLRFDWWNDVIVTEILSADTRFDHAGAGRDHFFLVFRFEKRTSFIAMLLCCDRSLSQKEKGHH